MLDKGKLSFIERAIVAIGLAKEGSTELYERNDRAMIGGTGFFISNGCVMTDHHVLTSLFDARNMIRQEDKINTNLAAFQLSVNDEASQVFLNYFEIKKAVHFVPSISLQEYTGPTNLL